MVGLDESLEPVCRNCGEQVAAVLERVGRPCAAELKFRGQTCAPIPVDFICGNLSGVGGRTDF